MHSVFLLFVALAFAHQRVHFSIRSTQGLCVDSCHRVVVRTAVAGELQCSWELILSEDSTFTLSHGGHFLCEDRGDFVLRRHKEPCVFQVSHNSRVLSWRDRGGAFRFLYLNSDSPRADKGDVALVVTNIATLFATTPTHAELQEANRVAAVVHRELVVPPVSSFVNIATTRV